MSNRALGRRLRPGVEPLADRILPSGFTPAQTAAAYGFDRIAFNSPSGAVVKGDGSGQTIAIVSAFHSPSLATDLALFSRTYGLAEPRLDVVNLAGNATNATWASESALDVEWAHALAPGASLVVVEARSDTQADLTAAVEVARNLPGVVAVSMSWALPEAPSQKALDPVFTTPAGHVGITFVAASGDGGGSGGAVYPASSANVLGVGGTTLVVDASGGIQSETTWADAGAGLSTITAEPGYQRALQKSGAKSVPDVAFLSDPDTGVMVYSTPLGGSTGSWQVVAGTSLGAPAWAAIAAIVAQGRALEGKPSLDGASQTLPLLYGLPSSSFNRVSTVRPGRSAAVNLAAGLGTPRADAVVHGLVSVASTTAAPAAAAAPATVPPTRMGPIVLGARKTRRPVVLHRQTAPKPRPTTPPHPHSGLARRVRLIARTTGRRAASAGLHSPRSVLATPRDAG